MAKTQQNKLVTDSSIEFTFESDAKITDKRLNLKFDKLALKINQPVKLESVEERAHHSPELPSVKSLHGIVDFKKLPVPT